MTKISESKVTLPQLVQSLVPTDTSEKVFSMGLAILALIKTTLSFLCLNNCAVWRRRCLLRPDSDLAVPVTRNPAESWDDQVWFCPLIVNTCWTSFWKSSFPCYLVALCGSEVLSVKAMSSSLEHGDGSLSKKAVKPLLFSCNKVKASETTWGNRVCSGLSW